MLTYAADLGGGIIISKEISGILFSLYSPNIALFVNCKFVCFYIAEYRLKTIIKDFDQCENSGPGHHLHHLHGDQYPALP